MENLYLILGFVGIVLLFVLVRYLRLRATNFGYTTQEKFFSLAAHFIQKQEVEQIVCYGLDKTMMLDEEILNVLIKLQSEQGVDIKFILNNDTYLPKNLSKISKTEFNKNLSELKRVFIQCKNAVRHEIHWDDTKLSKHLVDRKRGVIWRKVIFNAHFN